MNKCMICDIITSNAKSYIVYENDFFIAFLDIKPLFLGHCLLAPKRHLATIYDLPSVQGNSLLQTIQIVGRAIKIARQAEGTFIAVNNTISQSIDHSHIHVVPRNKGDGLKGFFWPRMKYKDEKEMLEVQLSIKNIINDTRQ